MPDSVITSRRSEALTLLRNTPFLPPEAKPVNPPLFFNSYPQMFPSASVCGNTARAVAVDPDAPDEARMLQDIGRYAALIFEIGVAIRNPHRRIAPPHRGKILRCRRKLAKLRQCRGRGPRPGTQLLPDATERQFLTLLYKIDYCSVIAIVARGPVGVVTVWLERNDDLVVIPSHHGRVAAAFAPVDNVSNGRGVLTQVELLEGFEFLVHDVRLEV